MLFPLLLATPYKIMINTNPTGRDTTEVAVQRLSQKLITKLNLQNSSRVFEDDSNNISAHDSVPRSLSKLNAALTAFDLSDRQDAEPIDSSKSYSEGEIVYAEGASWRVAAGGADAGDLPSTHPDKFVSFQEGVTSIANKATAYALTGVAAGTVYKTEDTGQVMEYLGDVLPLYGGFTIAGSSGLDALSDGYNGTYLFSEEGFGGNIYYRDSSTGQVIFTNATEARAGEVGHTHLGSYVHPADVTTWTAFGGSGSLLQSEFTKAAPESNPYNWKINGVVQVYNNDDKQLLTNLPDGQQVKVVGEAGRIEQLPPSPLPDIKRGFIVSSEGNPRSSASDGGNSVSGAFFWHEVDSMFVRDDDGSYYNAYIYHDGSRWNIGYQSGFSYFQSATCASTVHPADATGWTTYDSGSGIGQGTIANDGLVKTRACEVYNSPTSKTSGNTPWRTIVNTIKLYGNVQYTGINFHGVLLEPVNTDVLIGWVRPTDTTYTDFQNPWYVKSIDGVSQGSTRQFQGTDNTYLADTFPDGATVVIRNT